MGLLIAGVFVLVAGLVAAVIYTRQHDKDRYADRPVLPIGTPTLDEREPAPPEAEQESSHPELPVVKTAWQPERREVLEERRRKVQVLRAKLAERAAAAANAPTTAKRKSHRKSGFAPYRHFVVVDLETTGFSPAMDEIIEIGAVKIDVDSETHPAFQAFVKSSGRLSRRITRLTGITQGMLEEQGIPLAEALEGLCEFIGDMPLVAYNAPFDRGFLTAAAAKCGRSIDNEYVCALQLARRAWPGLESYKLSEMAKIGQLDLTDEHRALGDCTRTAHIYFKAASKLSEYV